MRKPKPLVKCNIYHLKTRKASPYSPLRHLGFARVDGMDYDYVYTPVVEKIDMKHRGEPCSPGGVGPIIKWYYRGLR